MGVVVAHHDRDVDGGRELGQDDLGPQQVGTHDLAPAVLRPGPERHVVRVDHPQVQRDEPLVDPGVAHREAMHGDAVLDGHAGRIVVRPSLRTTSHSSTPR